MLIRLRVRQCKLLRTSPSDYCDALKVRLLDLIRVIASLCAVVLRVILYFAILLLMMRMLIGRVRVV